MLGSNQTIRKSYNLSGKAPITYNEIVDLVASKLGKRITKLHFPVNASLFLVKLISKIPGFPRFTTEQVMRLNEDKAFSHQAAIDEFGFNPLSFEEGITREIEEYKSLKED